MGKHRENLLGQKFGLLTVIDKAENLNVKTRWLCRCECGTEKIIASAPLKRGLTVSCNCRKSIINKQNSGSNHYNWKGGVTPLSEKERHSVEYYGWRYLVFSRDKHTCAVPSCRNHELEAHHIKSFSQFPELRYEIENGITLCKDHHQEFHSLYSKTEATKEDLEKYLYET